MEPEQRHLCPKCGYEYEPWVNVCPDCGTPIEDKAPLRVIRGALDPENDPRWTPVTNVPNAIIGNFMKSQLEDAGIPVLMMRMKSADIAEFSHNDFVPQNLLVPLHLVREARRLIDSAPGDEYGAHFDEEAYPYEGEHDFPAAEPGAEGSSTPASSGLPEGWTMLPTEADLTARQDVLRSRGESLRGWYWSDGQQAAEEEESEPPEEAWDPGDARDPLSTDDFRQYNRDVPYSYGPGKWIRFIYALLLLALSMPFILQVVGQIVSVFQTGR